MAEKKVIELEVKNNVDEVSNDFNKLDNEIKDVNNSLKETNKITSSKEGVDQLSKKLAELDNKLKSNNLTTREMNKVLKEYQTIAAQAGSESPVGRQAIAQAASLKDQLTDLQVRTKILSSDYIKMDTTLAAIGTGAQAFQGIQSAMILTGVESKELQAAMVKLQAIQGVSNSISAVTNALNKDAILGIQLRVAWEKIQTTAIQATSTALGKLKMAFAATGIGLLVTGLGLLIAYWDDLKEAVGGVTEEEQKLADFRRKHEQERREFVAKESKDFASSLAQLKASNKGSKERSELITEINQKYGTTLKNLSDEAAFQNQINQELENYLKYQTAKFKLQANEDAIVQNLKTQSRLRQEIAQSEKDLAQAIQEGAGKTRRTLEDGVLTTVDVNEKASIAAEQAAKKIRENEKALADAEKRFENYGKAALKAGEDISKLTNNGKKYVEQNKEVVKKTKEATEKVIEETRKQGEITQEQEDFFTQMLIDSEAKKQKIRDEAKAKQEEEELMLMQFKGDLYKQDVDNFDEAEAKKKKLREDNLKSSVKAGIDALNLIASIAEMNAGQDVARQKKAFGIRKAANIASATIDGYKAVLSTYADTAGGPVIKGIAAAIAGAFAALQIASIAKQEFNSGGGSPTPTPSPSPSGGAGGSVISPNFNIVGNAQATNPLAGLGNQPLQAYVVSGEVTTAQSLDRNRINYATFG
jgi:hypothetical protein